MTTFKYLNDLIHQTVTALNIAETADALANIIRQNLRVTFYKLITVNRCQIIKFCIT